MNSNVVALPLPVEDRRVRDNIEYPIVSIFDGRAYIEVKATLTPNQLRRLGENLIQAAEFLDLDRANRAAGK